MRQKRNYSINFKVRRWYYKPCERRLYWLKTFINVFIFISFMDPKETQIVNLYLFTIIFYQPFEVNY